MYGLADIMGQVLRRVCLSVFECVYMCLGACMLVCVWYTELTCIPDVWPSGHYGSGLWPCLCVCVCRDCPEVKQRKLYMY